MLPEATEHLVVQLVRLYPSPPNVGVYPAAWDTEDKVLEEAIRRFDTKASQLLEVRQRSKLRRSSTKRAITLPPLAEEDGSNRDEQDDGPLPSPPATRVEEGRARPRRGSNPMNPRAASDSPSGHRRESQPDHPPDPDRRGSGLYMTALDIERIVQTAVQTAVTTAMTQARDLQARMSETPAPPGTQRKRSAWLQPPLARVISDSSIRPK